MAAAAKVAEQQRRHRRVGLANAWDKTELTNVAKYIFRELLARNLDLPDTAKPTMPLSTPLAP